MKKLLISTAIIGLALGCASVQAISEAIERGYISVNTTANVELAPDVAKSNFSEQRDFRTSNFCIEIND